MEKQLGTMPDTELAKQLGISPYWVRKRRSELGTDAHVIPENPKSERKKGKELPEDVIELICKVPGKQISDRFRVPRMSIRLYRALHAGPSLGGLQLPLIDR